MTLTRPSDDRQAPLRRTDQGPPVAPATLVTLLPIGAYSLVAVGYMTGGLRISNRVLDIVEWNAPSLSSCSWRLLSRLR